jgi:hypothetical protein
MTPQDKDREQRLDSALRAHFKEESSKMLKAKPPRTGGDYTSGVLEASARSKARAAARRRRNSGLLEIAVAAGLLGALVAGAVTYTQRGASLARSASPAARGTSVEEPWTLPEAPRLFSSSLVPGGSSPDAWSGSAALEFAYLGRLVPGSGAVSASGDGTGEKPAEGSSKP